ncbi:hypothetical protein K0B96_03475 [Horticoccus luteus]|uniref:Uncharacterized protein n=1 Tax=Horticoccus luteus TaxID=2862869 RepID=A0A8F9TWR4_9BACT|nr:hypothetical protein [Horticoccus luteus]QYM79693.1 hypothetical protein K0B96_03475 [Horticoccus luteus]
MPSPALDRLTLIACVHTALENQPWAHTLWEGGSASFGRTDTWSDADLQAVVDDDHVPDAFAAVESALAKIAPVDDRLIVPEPAWHGHSQRFYRFTGSPPWLLLDFCVMKLSAPYKFNDELHGRPPVLFDRAGLFARPRPVDRLALETRLRDRLAQLTARLKFFGHFPDKELRRGHLIDALHWYQSIVLTALVEMLRIKHDPLRHNWGNRYLHQTLPAADAARLQRLMFVADPAAIPSHCREALAWLESLAAELAAMPSLANPH